MTRPRPSRGQVALRRGSLSLSSPSTAMSGSPGTAPRSCSCALHVDPLLVFFRQFFCNIVAPCYFCCSIPSWWRIWNNIRMDLISIDDSASWFIMIFPLLSTLSAGSNTR